MAITASFLANAGVLSIFSDNLDNTVTVSRNAAGTILVNGGAVAVQGGTPTVANTALIQAFGLGGNDNLRLDESNGALPATNLFGGAGNDTASGGSGADLLFGQSENDVLLGRGGNDNLFGGAGNDTLTGGDGDDQVFGEAGDDRMIWNPGDDTDLFEGGDGTDTAEVNGGSGNEIFSVTANGTRVRFDRLDPAPFTIDIGTTERLILNAGGGNDVVSASGNLAALIALTIDGGAGNDTILGGNGADTLLGGDGDDLVDGNQGNDVAFLGAGNDTFQWDPGDGSDVVEGQAGTDTLLFNGNNGSENFEVSANGGRVLATRSVGNIVMDLNDVETIQFETQGGFDNVVVNDLTGTDAKLVAIDLAAAGTTVGDAQFDSVTVNGTNAANNIAVALAGSTIAVTGLAAQVTIDHADAGDGLAIKGLGGNDTINAAALPAGVIQLTVDGGVGNDTINGSLGSDVLLGGDGNDSVFGDNGDDVALLGAGNDVFRWAPGDGNDIVEGQGGTDTLAFDGANVSENVDIFANGGRVLFIRDIANVVMDLNDIEVIQFRALNGFDRVAVHDLTGTDVKQVAIDLSGAGNPAASDGAADSVSVDGTNANDQVAVALVGAAVSVAGTFAPVAIQHADAFDTLTVNGFGGDDLINGAKLPATAMQLALDGGAGNDTLVGGGAGDVLIGGDGDDSLRGGLGNDVALLGAGDDVFGWKAGDGSDVIEGQDGFDRLDVTGTNAVETFDLFANGGRALLFHSAGNEVLDLNDVERVQIKALGGTDHISVHDLTGTDVTQVAIDLAGTPNGTAGDGKVDTITLDGIAGNDIINLSLVGDEIVVDGLAAQVTIDHADKSDLLVIDGSAGADFIDAHGLAAGYIGLQLFGADGGDVLIGSAGNDSLEGGAGNDQLDGGLGNDSFRYSSPLDGHDVIDNFDGNAGGGQDSLNLDALFDSLGVAAADRAGRVAIADHGATVDVAIDLDGNAANGFELTAATLNTNDAITVGQDVLLGT